MDPIDDRRLPRQASAGRRLTRKEMRKHAISARALADLEAWMSAGDARAVVLPSP
jgi:hypothetical protein